MTPTIIPVRVLTLSLIALLALLPLSCRKGETAAAEAEEEHAAPVKWEPIEKADIEEWIELLGTTEPLPNHIARVSAAVEGHVLEVLPKSGGKALVEGQRVKTGQVLVRLDDRIPRANKEKLKAGDAELKEQIVQAENVVQLAKLDLERLERLQATRAAGLGSLPLVTSVELDRARVAVKDAESKKKAVQAKEEIAHAEVRIVDEQLHLYELLAPIDGQLGIVHAVPGQTLAVGAVVAEVINLDEIDVLCYVPARTVAHLRLDQPVRLDDSGESAGDDKKKIEDGRIVFIADQAQAESGAVAVKARFPNRHRKLRANTIVRARVLKEKKHDCLSIPVAALLEDQEEPAVLLVEKGEKKEEDKKEDEKKEDNKKEDEKKEADKKEGEKKEDDKKDGEKKEGDKEEEKHHVRKLLVKLGLRGKERVELLGLIDPKDKKPVPLEKGMIFVTEGGHGLEDGDLVKEKEEEHKEGEGKEEHKEGEKKEEHKDGEKKAEK